MKTKNVFTLTPQPNRTAIGAGATGYVSYTHEGWGVEQGERQKRASWKEAIKRRRAESAHDVEFVPFSIEAGGVWGPAAIDIEEFATSMKLVRDFSFAVPRKGITCGRSSCYFGRFIHRL